MVFFDLLKIILGGIIGAAVMLYYERRKAWKAYNLIRVETNYNIQKLQDIYNRVCNIYGLANTDKEIDIIKMMNANNKEYHSYVKNLLSEAIPIWSYGAWNSQMQLLPQILTDQNVNRFFILQNALNEVVRLHTDIIMFAGKHKPPPRKEALKKWANWKRAARRALKMGNPFPIKKRVGSELIDWGKKKWSTCFPRMRISR